MIEYILMTLGFIFFAIWAIVGFFIGCVITNEMSWSGWRFFASVFILGPIIWFVYGIAWLIVAPTRKTTNKR